MPSVSGLFGTRVAHRLLGLFVAGALLPVVVMGVISFFAVRRQLEEGSEDRLRRLAGNAAQSVAQQLFVVQGGLRQLGRLLTSDADGFDPLPAAMPPAVEAMAVVNEAGISRPLTGVVEVPPILDATQRAHLSGGGMLVSLGDDRSRGGILAAVALDSAHLDAGVLWARLIPDSIWGPADEFTALSTRSDFCVLGVDDQALYCHSGGFGLADAFRRASVAGSHAGVFRAEVDGQDLITGFRRLLLASAFLAPTLTILVSESAASVQAPLSAFTYSFPLALLLGLLAVLLLTYMQVRRTMEPLTALGTGTRQIASGDLSTRIRVDSRDEFGTLADSFNGMAESLDLMFRQIETGRAVDQAVLRLRSADEAVSAILDRFPSLVPCAEVSVLLVEDESRGIGRLRSRRPDGEEHATSVWLDEDTWAWIREARDHRVVAEPSRLPGADGSEPVPGAVRILVPFMAGRRLLGALWYDPVGGGGSPHEGVARARHVADQATVALDELRLLHELEELNWGTLRALARAIDAKSPWTAGHSERVTALALEIAKELGLDEAALETLNRGGLLHDVGKIGVPARILDHRGELAPEDRALMRRHPTIGAEILEPIGAFRPALPIVAQHHERWDGSGYPDGLVGERIDPLARVLAVADVYDAMISDRPYRVSLGPEAVLASIRERRGTQFEPRVVDALIAVLADRGGGSSARG